MPIPDEFLDLIRQRVPVSQVVGRRVRLKKAGREYIGLSPFNKEKSPSFTVNDDKQFYHCFSSGKHGDVIRWMIEAEGMSFPEAVEALASMAGLEVPRQAQTDKRRQEKRAGIAETLEIAAQYYQKMLFAREGAEALDYLKSRGLTAETISQFRLGYAPRDGAGLIEAARAQNLDQVALLTATILRKPDDGRSPYPFLRDRVVFPVLDRRGRVIAFGGRVIPRPGVDARAAKYLNSPEHSLFDKSRTLFNVAQARVAAASGQVPVVVEGYMDVIALAQAGVDCAVAPLGTALTENQIAELWRLRTEGPSEPILCFDGDRAGRGAAYRALDRALPLLQPGKSLSFAFLPAGEDPDSLVRVSGKKAFEDVLARAEPLFEVMWQDALDRCGTDTPERRALVESSLNQKVEHIADRGVQKYYAQMVRERIWQEFGARKAGHAGKQAAKPWQGRSGNKFGQTRKPVSGAHPTRINPQPLTLSQTALERHKRALLVCIINHPELFSEFSEPLAEMRFEDPQIDGFCQEAVNALVSNLSLDPESLWGHLYDRRSGVASRQQLETSVLGDAPFVCADTPLDAAARECRRIIRLLDRNRIETELRDTCAAAAVNGDDSLLERAFELRRILSEMQAEESQFALDDTQDF